MSMNETANRNMPTSRVAMRALVAGIALLAGVTIPFLGYGTLLASHGAEGPPRWVYVAIPAALAGPDIPSLAQFVGLAVVNVLLWFAITYGIGRGIAWGVGANREE
jgi:hypothetical protein